jgi:dTDP-4-amino-4,6-dideoxygalactose transaminase
MIALARPDIPEQAIARAAEIIRSGMLVQGACVCEFERQLSVYLGVQHVVVVSSGTAALHLTLLALDIGPGDEVVVPAFTFPATANAVVLAGAEPVLADINLDDFCINPAVLERVISPRTKAIMPVHEFGQAADMAAIMTIANAHGLAVIEDAACALGTEFEGKRVGTIGCAGCFSFHPRKALTTGEGGAVVTDDDQIANRVRALRNHGMVPTTVRPDFRYAGFNYRMTDFQAALAPAQLAVFEETVRARITAASRYDALLVCASRLRVPARFSNRRMVYQTYHVLLEEGIERDAVISAMRQLGVETNIGAYALNLLTYFKTTRQWAPNDFPCAVAAFARGLALPIGPHVGEVEAAQVVTALTRCLAS